MRDMRRLFGKACLLVGAGLLAAPVHAEEPKHGGILRIYHRDSPASASILEEATFSTNIPFMGVYNNLVLYDQHKPQNSIDTIVPELAESWSLNDDKTKLTFKLRTGVKWHDGKPFTAADVKCTFDLLMGKSKDKLRKNPRETWYNNVVDVTTNGDNEASFNLKRPQPSLIALLASGYSPI
jgi:peptide/nickel transport system substrate-binding protein